MLYDKQRGVHWPQLAILACLFVLSIVIPIGWHRAYLRMRQANQPSAAAKTPLVRARTDLTPEVARPARPNVATLRPPIATQPRPAQSVPVTVPVAPPESVTALVDPGQMAIQPPRLAETAPMFADLVELDDEQFEDDLRISHLHRDTQGVPAYRLRIDETPKEQDFAPPFPTISTWPKPAMLLAALDKLADDPQASAWAANLRWLLDELSATSSLDAAAVRDLLPKMRHVVTAAADLEESLASATSRHNLRNAAYALSRRLDIWEITSKLASQRAAAESQFASNAPPLSSTTSAHPHRVNLVSLLADLELYEHTRLSSQGVTVGSSIESLGSSADPQERLLGKQLEYHYRGANFRVALNSQLFNRLLPQQRPEAGAVSDEILGLPVWGESLTVTKLHLRPIPDQERIRLGLEAWGVVKSETTAESGPVRVHNRGNASYIVRKLIVVDEDGVKTKPAIAKADSRSSMVGVETSLDRVPLVGGMVRNMATRRAAEQRGRANSEVERKLTHQATQRFDREFTPLLLRLVARFEKRIWGPLVNLGLEPTPIEMASDEHRAITRVRLANHTQLAGHTMRPYAPSDSLASMQINESLLNNGLGQFDLAGKTMTLPELYRSVADRINRHEAQVPETMPDNVYITFAERDPVRVHCDDGRVRLTLSLAEVKRKKERWTNLVINAEYEPDGEGLNAELVRHGSIELSGDRIGTVDQVALRGAFSKLLSRSHRVQLVPEELVKDKRLADLDVTQFVIDDGWIAVALGPSRGDVSRDDNRPQTASQTKRRRIRNRGSAQPRRGGETRQQ